MGVATIMPGAAATLPSASKTPGSLTFPAIRSAGARPVRQHPDYPFAPPVACPGRDAMSDMIRMTATTTRVTIEERA